MDTSISSFQMELLRLLRGEQKFINYENCHLEVVFGTHPLPNEFFDGEDLSSFSYIHVSRQPQESDDSDKLIFSQKLEESTEMIGSPLSLNSGSEYLKASPLSSVEKQGEVVNPVLAVSARKLISLYNLSCMRLSELSIIRPMWVFCNGLDTGHLAFLSSHVKSSRSIANFSVTIQGPFLEDHKFPSVKDLLSKRLVKEHSQFKYSALYRLFGSAIQDVSDLQSRNHGYVNVLLQWDKDCHVLSEPPPDASASLSISIKAGSPRSAAHHLYEELITLQGFVEGLDKGLVKWAVEDNPCCLFEQIEQLMEDEKKGSMLAGKSKLSPESKEDEMTLQEVLLAKRLDLDFTELLWKILKDCTSYKELTDSLQLILENIQKKEIQPMVHRSNNSSLARLIRNSYQDEPMNLPSLEGTTPLEFLVDIGFEKLSRDYSTAFLGTDLVLAGHLEYFVARGESGQAAERLRRIEKLHLVLEIVTALDQYLMLPRPTLSIVARQALKYYETNNVRESDIFQVPISLLSIAPLLKGNLPKMWKASVIEPTTSSDDVRARAILTAYSPFPHATPSTLESDDLADNIEQKIYYLTVINKTQLDL